MINSGGDAATEFIRHWHRMITLASASKIDPAEVEDVAGAVAIEVCKAWARWTAVEYKAAYLRKAFYREIGRWEKRRKAEKRREGRWGHDWLRSGEMSDAFDSVADSYEYDCEMDGVRRCLSILRPRQREVLAWCYLQQQRGWNVQDLADALGISPNTIRRHRQDARQTLRPYLFGGEHDHRRSLRSGERVHEDFHRGQKNLLAPRPVILNAWELARKRGLDPERGTQVVLLDPDELDRRRQESPIPMGSPELAALDELGAHNELLAVVLDADNIVLHRGGHREALAAADELGFLDGASWDLDHAGITAAGLARMLGRPITVNRWEHSFLDQHGLCCIAIPIRSPQGAPVTLNLTSTTEGFARMPVAIVRELYAMGHRLHQQWRTPGRTQ